MLFRSSLYVSKAPCWITLVVILLYCILLLTYISPYEMNLSSLLTIGREDSYYSPSKIDNGYVVYNHGGYDGQYNYYILKDFPLRGEFANPYRYQRILYPVLVYLFSLGNSHLFPIMFILLNLASVWLGMHFLLKLLDENNEITLFLLMLYGLNIGFTTAVFYDLGTPLAIMLLVLAYYFYSREKWIPTSICLGLSLLTMENAWLVITPLVLWSLYQKQWRTAGILFASVIPWFLWQCILAWKFSQFPIFASAGLLDIPLKGIIDYLQTRPWKMHSFQEWSRQMNVLPLMLFMIYVLIISAFILWKEKTLPAWLVLFHALFALFLSYSHIWSHTITSPSRVLSGVFPFLMLLYVSTRYRYSLSVALTGCWLLTLMGLIRFIYLPQHSYLIISR